MEKRFDPIINTKLQAFAKASQWLEMLDYLRGLSNSGFRVASYLLAERVLPDLDHQRFWDCFKVVVTTSPKAFLVTFLKAAVTGYKKEILAFSGDEFLSFAHQSQEKETSVDRQKTLLLILSEMRTYQEVEEVLEAFCGTHSNLKMHYLVSSQESKPCYFAMFRLMRMDDLDHDEITKYLRQILRRSTTMAFNFVSIMRQYFDIKVLNGQFSLSLQPYELSRLENNYEIFVSVLTSM